MMPDSAKLLLTRRFGPLFSALSLGAFNDNFFKQCVVLAIMFRVGEAAPFDPAAAATVAAAVFIAPFFLLSASAGQLADAVGKAKLVRRVKLAEVAIMSVGAWGLIGGDVWLMLAALGGMGVQSALFGPAKYASLPALLRRGELLEANGLVQAVTFVSILGGMVAGGLVMASDAGAWIGAAAVVAMAAVGWASSWAVPETPVAAPGGKVGWNLPVETWRIIRDGLARRELKWPLLGTAFFWLSGLAWVSLAPVIAERVLGGAEIAATLVMAAFAVGVGVGATGVSRLLGGEVTPRLAPVFGLLIAVFALDAAATVAGAPAPEAGRGVSAMFGDPVVQRLLVDMALMAAAGGAFVTPLHTVVQRRAPDEAKARFVAANNVIDTAGMALSAGLAAVLIGAGVPLAMALGLFAGFAAVVALGLAFACRRLLVASLVRGALTAAFRLRVKGLDNLKVAGEKAVIAPNHASFLDGLLLAAVLPGRPVFAVNLFQARRWWVRLALSFVDYVEIDPTSPMAARTLSKEVAKGRRVVIFPEGRITTTGGIMKVYPGPGVIADHAEAPVVPVRIEGAERSLFSRLGGKMRRVPFPRVTISVHPPVRNMLSSEIKGRKRRAAIQWWLQEAVSEAAFREANVDRSLWRALLDAKAVHGGGRVALDDADRSPMTYRGLVRAALALGRAIERRASPGENVGVLLPTSRGGAVTTLALQARGLVPAMLNFSAGAKAVREACETAQVRTVLTSRRFVEQGKLEALVDALGDRVVYLEDVRGEIGALAKVRAAVEAAVRPEPERLDADAPAVVLFTSGSEGAPKGVVLSHRNVLANCAQLRARVPFSPADIVLNVLPIFHAFGLTGGLYLPLLNGVMTVCHPSPLHYRHIPEIAYSRDATLMFATDTFLRGYARAAQDFDFSSLKFVFAGAEKVREETRREWSERFGVRVLEGYGATECSPVIAVNTPIECRPGTVGKPLPGMEVDLERVEGVESGRRLHVSGPNVMLGYLRHSTPGRLESPPNGRYDTGDIVSVDGAGYLKIEGRAKRFAKIGGEMVSLAAVEALAEAAWPEARHAAVSLPDPRKGERVALLTDAPEAERTALQEIARERGASELSVPAEIAIGEVPVLGTGKTDYGSVKAALERRDAA